MQRKEDNFIVNYDDFMAILPIHSFENVYCFNISSSWKSRKTAQDKSIISRVEGPIYILLSLNRTDLRVET